MSEAFNKDLILPLLLFGLTQKVVLIQIPYFSSFSLILKNKAPNHVQKAP